MDAVKFLEEWEIMMETDPKAYAEAARINTNHGLVDYVEQWSKDDPQKTRLQDFLEKFPKAEPAYVYDKLCCEKLGYCNDCHENEEDCVKCWNKPIE